MTSYILKTDGWNRYVKGEDEAPSSTKLYRKGAELDDLTDEEVKRLESLDAIVEAGSDEEKAWRKRELARGERLSGDESANQAELAEREAQIAEGEGGEAEGGVGPADTTGMQVEDVDGLKDGDTLTELDEVEGGGDAYDDMDYSTLQQSAKTRGLNAGGSAEDLRARLRDADAE